MKQQSIDILRNSLAHAAVRRLHHTEEAALRELLAAHEPTHAQACHVCHGTGWNHGAQPGPGPGYKTIKCTACNYWSNR